MRRLVTIFILLLLVILIMVGGRSVLLRKIDSVLSQQPPEIRLTATPTPTSVPVEAITHELFVPYWGLHATNRDLSSYQKLIYFGIGVTSTGINKNDQGYASLPEFLTLAEGKEKVLTVRMVDSDTNLEVLKNKKAQKQIIEQSISIAKENGFSGVLLNLELSALPFDSLIDQITVFNKDFYTEAKRNELEYGITAYGDTFYRLRPFNIKDLSKSTDDIYIMTYDFHKAKGNPGPNFPLQGNEKYGYDLGKMIDTFLTYSSGNKLTVIYGFYGYDWQVDDKGMSQDLAEPVTLKEAETQFIKDCSYLSCEWRRDRDAAEIEVKYIDENKKQHVVWFEDMESVKRKEEFLKTRGITNFAHWAYSYF